MLIGPGCPGAPFGRFDQFDKLTASRLTASKLRTSPGRPRKWVCFAKMALFGKNASSRTLSPGR